MKDVAGHPIRHLIQRQTLELSLASEAEAHDLNAELWRLQEQHLEPLLNEIFSSATDENEVVRLNRVVVDLGVLSATEFTEQFLAVSRRRLTEQLVMEINSLRDSSTTAAAGQNSGKFNRLSADLDTLRHFLITGQLPWWATSDSAEDLPSLLAGKLKASPEPLLAMLRSCPVHTIAQRMALQFPAPLLVDLLRGLSPAANDAGAILADWSELYGDLRPPSPRPSSFRAVTSPGLDPIPTIGAILLERCLRNDGSTLGNASLLAHLAAQEMSSAMGLRSPSIRILADAAKHALPKESLVRRWLSEQATSPRASASLPSAGATQRPASKPVSGHGEALIGVEGPGMKSAPVPDPVAAFDNDHLATTKDPSKAIATDTSLRTDDEEFHYLDNAGLVLLWPFLDRFFNRLGLIRDKAFISPITRERGVLLLQHLVTGGREWPEPHLTLNKLLCDWPIQAPLARKFQPTGDEVEAGGELLASVIAHWQKIGKTSVDGLRSSFLQRSGRLVQNEDAWNLTIERVGYDVLLDSLPWGIGLVLLPWMRKPLVVEW